MMIQKTHLIPQWQDAEEVMESIVSAIKPVSYFTDILSTEEHVTASCLKLLLTTSLVKHWLKGKEIQLLKVISNKESRST